MAFSLTLDKRISVGNRKGKIFTVTDVQAAGSEGVTGLRKVRLVSAINTSDNTDTFKEKETSGTEGSVTLTSGTNNDDGKMMVIGW